MRKFFAWIRQRLGTNRIARRVYRRLPSHKRCKECLVPFLGFCAVPFRLLQIRPSRKNPNLCTLWYELAPPGGELRILTVLFVDIRGFTALAERTGPAAIVGRLNAFYEVASQAIFRYDGTLDKLVGDQVMAFFGPPLNHEDHSRRAVMTALEIMRGVANLTQEESLAVGMGINTGEAFVGNVGGADVTDYTVLGDTVNVAARLQAEAAPGEILISQETYDAVAPDFPQAARRDMLLKGKSDSVIAWEIGQESLRRGI